jgi:hypothetical protein
MASFEVLYSFKIYQHTKYNGPRLTIANFAFISEVSSSDILEWLKVLYQQYGVVVTLNDMASQLNFIKMYKMFQKLLGGGGEQTDKIRISQISLFF